MHFRVHKKPTLPPLPPSPSILRRSSPSPIYSPSERDASFLSPLSSSSPPPPHPSLWTKFRVNGLSQRAARSQTIVSTRCTQAERDATAPRRRTPSIGFFSSPFTSRELYLPARLFLRAFPYTQTHTHTYICSSHRLDAAPATRTLHLRFLLIASTTSYITSPCILSVSQISEFRLIEIIRQISSFASFLSILDV